MRSSSVDKIGERYGEIQITAWTSPWYEALPQNGWSISEGEKSLRIMFTRYDTIYERDGRSNGETVRRTPEDGRPRPRYA